MKRIVFYFLAISIAVLSSCDKEETTEVLKKAPEVTTSDASVSINDEVTISFQFETEAGFKLAKVITTNGQASVVENPKEGATSGKIDVTFEAPNTIGASTVTLTVTDKNALTGTATAAVAIKSGISVSENIKENTTWKTGKVYILDKRVSVEKGATLTIEAGVVVKGAAGTGANATALVVARGAKIMANGTATSPIIFTSVADQIKPGEVASPNLATDLDGLWGGVIILGAAPISVDGNTTEAAIEGIPADDVNGKYGGNKADDNSGVFKYVSIRHGGSNIGEGNEINGLTLGGVGSKTIIENVEIIANQDDGVEWFGGAVNVKNLIVWNNGDDAVDTDQGWSGTLDNFLIINPGDKCFELDGPEGSINKGRHTIKNGSIKVGKGKGLLDLDKGKGDKNSLVNLSGLYWYGINKKGDPSAAEYVGTEDVTYSGVFNWSPSENHTDKAKYFEEGLLEKVTEVAKGSNTVGAKMDTFKASWSWAIAAKAN